MVPVKRFNTECSEEWNRGVKQLQKHVMTLSRKHRFNKPKKIVSKPDNERSSLLERKKFMMRQIDFTEEDEAKVMEQQQFLRQFEHSRESVLKRVGKNEKEEAEIIECMKTIARIYSVLNELERMGFALRTNKKVIRYCLGSHPWLKKVFLERSSSTKDAFLEAPKHLVLERAEQAQRSLVSLYMSGRGI